jgi:2-dehydropantoate 2-reductase
MKRSAYLVNTSRGPIVDEDALARALGDGTIAGAGLDVFDEEPLPQDHPFRRLPNIVITPHLGYVTEETYRVFYGQALEDVKAYLGGEPTRVPTAARAAVPGSPSGRGAISYPGLSRAGHDDTGRSWPTRSRLSAGTPAVTGPYERSRRPAAVHHEAARLPRDFAIAFVAMKAYDTAWATQLALRHLAPDGYVVSAQNCWPDPVVAAVAGPSRAVGLVMSRIGVALWTPGQVERGVEKGQGTGHDVFRAGEHDGGLTPRVVELVRMLSIIDGARATDNLPGERWAKLGQNAMSNPVQAMSGLGSLEVAGSEVGRTIMIHLAAESARVGLALGYRGPGFSGAPPERWADAGRPETYEGLDRMLTPTSAGGRSWRASMAQDVIKGRPTEIDHMNGHVVAQGQEVGVPTPVSAAVVKVVHEVEAGVRAPSPPNIDLALRRGGV